jgi:hypothetical protein
MLGNRRFEVGIAPKATPSSTPERLSESICPGSKLAPACWANRRRAFSFRRFPSNVDVGESAIRGGNRSERDAFDDPEALVGIYLPRHQPPTLSPNPTLPPLQQGAPCSKSLLGLGFDHFEPAVLPSRRFSRILLAWKIAVSSADATNPLPQSNAAAATAWRPGQQKSSGTWV